MFRKLQKLGKALMQPIALLPAAALLLGIGYWLDPTDWGGKSQLAAFLIKSGGAILDNLGILFAVGVAYGLSKDNDGSAALAGLVSFLVVTTLLSTGAVAQLRGVPVEKVLPAEGFDKINNPFIGIITGILASQVYNKFHKVKLPDFLAFFSGRRSVPIITSICSLVLAAILFFVWPIVYSGLVGFGTAISSMGALGAGIYAFFNRLLIPTGLHHALNSVFWFNIIGIDDIKNFWAAKASTFPGVTTGMYQAGFFPIMMFGLPGACLAMYQMAKPERKVEIKSLFMAAAFASFVTGVTEPIEFSFMFVAPGLYLIHALLTGISVYIAASFKWIAGFGFSAGLIDFILSQKVPIATKSYMLLVMGVVFFFIYYFLFLFFIKTFNLKTPGREDEIDPNEGTVLSKDTNFQSMAATIIEGLGGVENIDSLDHCATRLRVEVKDSTLVSESKIKSTRVAGVIRPDKKSVQVIVGPQVQFVYDEAKTMWKNA